MATVSNEVPPTEDDEVKSSPSESKPSVENEAVEQTDASPSTKTDEEKNEQVNTEQNAPSDAPATEPEVVPQSDELLATTSDGQEQKIESVPSEEIPKEDIDSKRQEKKSKSIPTEDVQTEDSDRKSQGQVPTSSKSRSVNFASKVDDTEIPRSRSTSENNTRSTYSSSKSSRRPVDFIDALVESYKLETSNNTSPMKEEKKYVPKTNRSRLNPNWREHRTKCLMNKLEELSLWDREEEMKASQAQALRDQKWEQIQDRQRNHDLCLNLMRQRHESEMESAVLLDRGATGINDENTNASIVRAMSLSTPSNILAYDLPLPPPALKRRVKQEEERSTELKTPIGRYRQFETNMSNKLEKINQKLQPDHEIMRAYNPYRTAIPTSVVPLFSETYSSLLSVPDTQTSNKYNQYHYGVAPYLHQPQHAPSPDYESRLKSYSNRDVRVPLKEQANDYNYYDDETTDEHNRSNSNDYLTKYRSNLIDDDYPRKHRLNLIDEDYQSKYQSSSLNDDDYYTKYRSKPIEDDYYTKYRSSLSSKLDYSPPRRTTTLASPTASALYDYSTVANTPRDYSFIHSSQPLSNSVHLRSLNDDLNAITRFSGDTSRRILQNIGDSPTDVSTKSRSSSSLSTNKHVSFHDQDMDNNDGHFTHNNSARNYSSKPTYQPVEILSLSSTR